MSNSIFRKDGTAQGVAKQRYIETIADPAKRVIDDPYSSIFTLGAGLIKLMGHGLNLWLTNKLAPGFHEHLIARTRFIDDLVKESAENGIEQYVILGAGYDMRAHRLDLPASLKIFEVVEGVYPKNIDECQGYLITGSRFSVYDEVDWIKRLKRFVLELHQLKKPLIGVCFGHQLIAQVLGGEAKEAESGWTIGNQTYNFAEDLPWIKRDDSSVKLLHSHKDQVTQLPPNAKLIASTEKVPIAMFCIENHIFSHQGHPEFTPDYVRDVATIRRKVLGEEVYRAAVDNLKKETPDNETVAKWWVNFFRSKT